jgi:tetratricopeptide (TPR) repeat protein
LLEQLVDRSLVIAESPGNPGAADAVVAPGPRFRLLAPIRDFAAAALAAGPSNEPVRDRHARHILDLVQREAGALADSADLDAVARLGLVDMDLRAALDLCLADPGADRAAIGVQMAAGLGRYWHLRGRAAEGLERLERCLSVEIDVPAVDRARALQWAGVLADDAGEPDRAARHLEAALEIRRAVGDAVEIARILNSLGTVARSVGDFARAEELLRESLEQKERLGDRRGTAVSLSNLGLVASDQGRLEEAAELLGRAFEIDEEVGGSALAIGAANLASALVRAGRPAAGIDRLRRGLPGIAELADPELVVEALVTVAEAALAVDGPAADRWAALLSIAAERVSESASIRLHDSDRRHLLEIGARATARVAPQVLEAVRAEARAVDVESGVALAGRAADELFPG